eukprot:16370996-Heterocapsa_arctica.AAC.1
MTLRLSSDKDKRTLTIEDNGAGLQTTDLIELIENLGRIARSGTANSVKNTKEPGGDVSLIGQSGVGLYSAFLVANKLKGKDRKSWKCISEGSSFTIQPAPEEEYYGETSGTKI